MKKQVLLFVCMVLGGSYSLLSQPGLQKGPGGASETIIFEHPDQGGGYHSQIPGPRNSEQQQSVHNSNLSAKEYHILNEVQQDVFSVTFNVDMTVATAEGGVMFNPEIHSVFVSGTFTQWAQPGSNPDYKLSLVDNVYTITLDIEFGEHMYKYFLVEDNPSWEMGEWAGDPNRTVFIDAPLLIENVWGSLTTLFSGGLGVSWNPFLVGTAQELDNVRQFPDAFFEQIADIDLGVAPWNEGDGWMPLAFYGTYNGNGYTIRNLTINRPQEEYIGLFGSISYSTLDNIHLKNVNITAFSRVGALCGNSYESAIYNCSAEGNVNALGNWAGGLVGVNYSYSGISASYAAVNVNATGYSVGGLSGTHESSSTVFNSYATGDVSGLRNVGGLIGFTSGYCNVGFCYSTGYISADLYTGGLIGRGDGTNSTDFSYWNVETSGQSISDGGTPLTTAQMLQKINFEEWDFEYIWKIIAGSTYPFLLIQNEPGDFNYPNTLLAPSDLQASGYDQKISISWEAPSVGIPTGYKLFRDGEIIASLEPAAISYDDTDVENYIMHTYYLIAVYDEQESSPSSSVAAFANTGFAGGDGTEGNPYLVSTPGELFTVRVYLESFFLQTTDIDLRVAPWNQDEGWLPIGTQSDPFLGQYDGNNHTISNLFINRDINMYQGLFSVNDGTIMNLGVIEAQIDAPMGMAGILSGTNHGLIENCYSTGLLSSTGSFGRMGGLTGWNSGTILDSRSSAVLNSLGVYIGGLTGANSQGMILQSYSDGNINGVTNIGGLAGLNQAGSVIVESFSNSQVVATGYHTGGLTGLNTLNSVISDSYSTGNVSGNISTGGLVGLLAENSSIRNCYSTGEVSGSEFNGGLVARNEGTENVTSSFWDTYSSGQLTSAGGTPKNTREMVTQQTFVDWDFEETWGIHVGLSYPYLLWQGEPGPHNFPDEIPEFFYLTLVANPPVGGTVDGAGSFLLGQVISIYATPNVGYRFVNWTGHTSYADHPELETCNVTMPAENIVLTANFEVITGFDAYDISDVKVFPNPATNKLWIEFENTSGSQMLVRIVNLMGQEIMQQKINEQGPVQIDLDISKYRPGLYFINIQSETKTYTRKVVIEN